MKLGEELTENENLVHLQVTCDKCKTNLASESALKLHNNMHHKYDKITSSRDMIDAESGFLNKQYDQTTQNCQCSKCDFKFGNGSDVENHIICQSLNGRVPTPVITVYNKDESSRTLDEKETNACMVTITEVIQTDITDQSSEKSDQKEVKKSAIFSNAEIVGYRQNNGQKNNSSENLKDISNKRFTADDHPEETIKYHEPSLEISINCDKCGVRFVGDTELKSHIHVKCENYKTILG